ncbi:MAG TPA: DUF2846 domain-containing protein [Stellaceae bacterium]|nr:DUF2846 domain-containing protein [Stellaceae bacterium]
MPGKSRWFLALLLAALAGCAGPQGPLFPQVAATIPPVAPDRARVYFYRDYEPYESLAPTDVFLNGATAGVSKPGVVFYRDVAPGTYDISVYSVGAFPNADKHVALKAGDTVYAKIESLHAWFGGGGGGEGGGYDPDTFVVMLIDPAQAQRELANMRYVQPPSDVARSS